MAVPFVQKRPWFEMWTSATGGNDNASPRGTGMTIRTFALMHPSQKLQQRHNNNNNTDLHFQLVGEVEGVRRVLLGWEDASVPVHVEGEHHVNPQAVRDQTVWAGGRADRGR